MFYYVREEENIIDDQNSLLYVSVINIFDSKHHSKPYYCISKSCQQSKDLRLE